LLARWGGEVPNKTPREVRSSLAALSNLETVTRRCPAFATFLDDLRVALA
jgi:hypothetical protein